MEVGPTFEGITHEMPESTISTILRSVPDGSFKFQLELGWDLRQFKFPLYDEIGMLLTGKTKAQTPELRKRTEEWATELAKDYLGCAAVSKDRTELYKCIEERVANRAFGEKFKNQKFNFSTEEENKTEEEGENPVPTGSREHYQFSEKGYCTISKDDL